MKHRAGKRKILLGMATVFLVIAGVIGGSTLLERRQQAEQEAQLRQLSASLLSSAWTDANTLYIDGELYGFDHRIETYLFIGTDAGESPFDEDGAYRGPMADFLLLMVLDHTDDTIGCLQIDRNTVTEVHQLDVSGKLSGLHDVQICTAYWYGHSPEMSAENTVDAVKQLLGEMESIDGYYAIDMRDIGTLNHAVGGVEITLDEDLTAVDSAFVPGATLTLSDEQAERFVRARMNVGRGENAERMSRQQVYMEGLFRKVKENTRNDLQYGAKLWKMLRDIASSNMNGNDFSRIAKKMLTGEDKGFFRLEGESKHGTVLEDGMLHEEFYPQSESIRRTMTELLSLVHVEDDDVDVEDGDDPGDGDIPDDEDAEEMDDDEADADELDGEEDTDDSVADADDDDASDSA